MKRLPLLAVSVPCVAFVLWVLLTTHRSTDTPRAAGPQPAAKPGDKTVPASPPTPPTTASAQPSRTSAHPEGPNAADIYKNAFVLYNALSEVEKIMLGKPREEVDADKADALFKKIQPIMELLRQAKDAAYCDWAMGEMSFSKPVPQMNLVMKLGSVARWSAGYQFLSSNPEGAISDLSTQAALGHSMGTQAAIGFLVETSINQGVVNLLRDNAAALSPETAAQALETLRSLDPVHDFAQAIQAEADTLAAEAEQLLNPETHDPFLQESGSATQPSEGDRASVAAQMNWCARVEKEFAAKALLPDAEYNAWWAQIQQQAATRPVATSAVSVLDTLRGKYQTAAVNNSMAAAGLVILQNGPEQLPSFLDPITGRPFTYVQTPTGFELRSTVQNKGKPLTMSFTLPAKQGIHTH